MLDAARADSSQWAANLVTVLERLGRQRYEAHQGPQWHTEYDRLAEGFAALHESRERDLWRFRHETDRLRRERDDARQAARDETARRIALQRRRPLPP